MSLPERAREYALRDGPDYGAWDLADLCREYEADTGERVSPGALAFAMLDVVAGDYRADLENLTSDDDWEEDAARERIKLELRDIERVQNGIEAAERGERVTRADVRALLHEWSVVPECRGCQGGSAARVRVGCARCRLTAAQRNQSTTAHAHPCSVAGGSHC